MEKAASMTHDTRCTEEIYTARFRGVREPHHKIRF